MGSLPLRNGATTEAKQVGLNGNCTRCENEQVTAVSGGLQPGFSLLPPGWKPQQLLRIERRLRGAPFLKRLRDLFSAAKKSTLKTHRSIQQDIIENSCLVLQNTVRVYTDVLKTSKILLLPYNLGNILCDGESFF